MPAADVAQSHFAEAEYFYAGRATAFDKDGAWGMDGVWNMKPATTAEYKVRFVVRRPADAARFNGVVIVEWLNVSGLQEGAADYMQMKEEIEREGYAWVGIGAQAAGVNTPRVGLKAWDPERYGALSHPGTRTHTTSSPRARRRFSIRKAVDPLGGLRVRHVNRDRALAVRVQARHLHQRVSSRARTSSTAFSCIAGEPTPQVSRRSNSAATPSRFLRALTFAPTSTCPFSICRRKGTWSR